MLPGWRGHLVVEVPAHRAAASRARCTPTPASTTASPRSPPSVDGSRSRRAPVHVFVNPQTFLPLAPRRRPGRPHPRGHPRRDVRGHAARRRSGWWRASPTTSRCARSDFPLRTTAARIIALVRRTGVPTHLPGRRRSSRPARRTSRRATRAPGSPAGCSPTRPARAPWSPSTAPSTRAAGGAAALRAHVGFGLRGLTERWRTLLAHLPA